MSNVTPMRWDSVPEGEPQPGIYSFGYDDALRYALNKKPGLMSYSKLKRFVNPDQQPARGTWVVGNLVSDRLLFGPDSIPGRYHFHGEQVKFNTKAGKAFRDQWELENPGVTLVRPSEREEAERLIEAALASPDLRAGLDARGICEAGLIADVQGVRFRSWVDKLTPRVILDLKTTRAATPEEFVDSVVKYGYDAQAALYLAQAEAIGLGQLEFRWGVISKTSGRAWVQVLQPFHYWTGMRWVMDNAGLFKRHGLLEQQLRDTIDQGGVRPVEEND